MRHKTKPNQTYFEFSNLFYICSIQYIYMCVCVCVCVYVSNVSSGAGYDTR